MLKVEKSHVIMTSLLNVKGREISCDYDELMKVYTEAAGTRQNRSVEKPDNSAKTEEKLDEADSGTSESDSVEEAPKRRRKKEESVEEMVGQDSLEEQEADEKRAEEEKPKKRTRKKRGE